MVDPRLHAGLKRGYRGIRFGEPPGYLEFEGRASLMRRGCYSGEDVTWQQAYYEPVRVVKDRGIINL